MKKLLSFILAAALVVSGVFLFKLNAADNPRIKYLQDKKIIIGDENGELNLTENITRDQFAKIVVYALGDQEKADNLIGLKSQFSDMKVGGWANGYVNVASTAKIVNGFPDGTFKPRQNVTYEEAIKMMVNTALGRDLTAAEKAVEGRWSKPYIDKAIELGLLKNLGVVDYQSPAVREKAFDILYEVLIRRMETPEAAVRGLVVEADDKGAKVLVISTDSKDIKAEDEISFKFSELLDARHYIGKVCDLTVGPESKITALKVAGEYEVKTGTFEILRNRLYMNGDKSGYDLSLSDRTKLEDNLAGILHNGVKYSYDKYEKENKNVDFAQVTVHNNKVVFIRSFNFKDIAPIADVKDGKVYVIKDANPEAISIQPLTNVYKVTKEGLEAIKPIEVPTDGVLHIYGNNEAIVTDKSLSDVTFRLSKKDGVLNFYVNGDYYKINTEKDKRGVISVDFENYKVIPNDENDSTLRAMETKKNVILLDLNNNVQLVRGNFAEKEETMIVEKVASGEIRMIDKNNKPVDVIDNLNLEILEGKKVIRMQDLNEGDLVYVSTKDNKVAKIQKYASTKDAKNVDKKGAEFAIDTTPSRGRYGLVTVDKVEYELTKDSDIIVNENGKYNFRTLEYVKKFASEGALQAVVVSTEAFQNSVPGAATPMTARKVLVKTIVFTNFKENVPVDHVETLKMVYGFVQGTDAKITAENNKGEKKELELYKNAKVDRLDPEDIVRVSLSKNGEVISVEKLIPYDYREYTVKEYSVKDGVTTVKIERDGKEFVKTFRKDITIFGEEPNVGSVVRMHVVDDDIDALYVIK